MKKFNIIAVLVILGVTLWGASHKVALQIKQNKGLGAYESNDPCSGDIMYKAAEDLHAGVISESEFDKIVAEYLQFQKENCKEGRTKRNENNQEEPKDSIVPSQSSPEENMVDKYLGFEDKVFLFEGGTKNACPERSLVVKTGKESMIYIMEQHCQYKDGICHFVKADKLIMSHKMDDVHISNPDSTLQISHIPAIPSQDTFINNKILPFALDNLYFKWRERQYECSVGIRIPPPGFHCQNHKNPSLGGKNECGNLVKEIRRIRNERKENTECEFVVLYPSRQGNEVFELRKNKKKVIKALDASLFHYPIEGVKFPTHFSDEQNKEAIGRLLYHLAVFIANDTSLQIIQTPNEKGLFFTVLGSSPDGIYIYCFGYNKQGGYVSYYPVDIPESVLLSHKVTKVMWNNANQRKHLLNMITKWQGSGEVSKIEAVLPETKSLSPLVSIGNPSSNDIYPPNIIPALDKNQPIEILIKNDDGYQILHGDGHISSTWLGKKLKSYSNKWLKYLAIADPRMNVISDSEHDGLFVFLFKDSPTALWSWQYMNELPPYQLRLLNGRSSFILNSNMQVSKYIKAIPKTSEKERLFWINVALQKIRIIPLDYFNSNGDHNLLFAYDYDPTPEAFRLSKSFDVNQKIHFNSVSIQPQTWNDWGNYYQSWRKQFERYIAYSHMDEIEVWFSNSRMGTSTKLDQETLVSVFLQNRSFNHVQYNSLIKEINKDELIFKLPVIPSKDQLFQDWLIDNWKGTNRWRANPLGYLERVKTTL